MSIKPILFNVEMVQAILDRRKTQTRRAIKLKYGNTQLEMRTDKYGTRLVEAEIMTEDHKIKNPDGTTTIKLLAVEDVLPPYQRGDVLWVRETWNGDWCDHYIYKADGGSAVAAGYAKEPRWRPSIHMPREAARIFLHVNNIRVERLQAITDNDAFSEGVPTAADYPIDPVYCPRCHGEGLIGSHTGQGFVDVDCPDCDTAKKRFAHLWDSTVKKSDCQRYGWDANPWCWVIEFERCENPEGWGQCKN